MINDMKLGIRLLRYGFGIKTNLVLLIVCTAADLLCFALELAGITTPLDGFMLLACVIPVQILFTLNVVTLCTTLAAYLIVVLKEAVIVLIHPDKTAQSAMRLVFLGVLVAVIMAFTGVLYKSFPALLVMYFSLSGFISFFMMPILRSDFLGEDRGSLVRAALIGVVLILAGGALEYALSVLFYKKPVSKKVLGERLSREL